MRAYVITLMDVPESVAVAQRCIDSGAEHGVKVMTMRAYAGKDDPKGMFKLAGWSWQGFEDNQWSRMLPCMATLLSHARIWQLCKITGAPYLILEHDAVITAPLPDLSGVRGVCNLGKPSFGAFKSPRKGIGPLTSKRFFPGAHGYYVTPWGAEQLLEKAKTEAEPTDVFLNLDRFPFLTEFYPWPIECEDSFSTIQNEKGCRAKHREVKPL